MPGPRISERVVGADGRVYQVATMRLRYTGPYGNPPLSELWETMVMEARGCLTPLPSSGRYVRYTYLPDQAQQAHSEAIGYVSSGENPLFPGKPYQWQMTKEQVKKAKDDAWRIFHKPPLADDYSDFLDQ